MGGIIQIAGTLLSRAEQRASAIAQNMANLTTPGYRSVGSFGRLITIDDPEIATNGDEADLLVSATQSPGKLIESGNPFDLALASNGYFLVRHEDSIYLTRAGQFRRDDLGRLVTPVGDILQTDQGDAVVEKGDVVIASDGTITQGGRPAGRLAIMDVADPSALRPAGSSRFAAEAGIMQTMDSPVVRQGMIEASNVSQTSEMLALMQVMRSAETGQRLVQTYDDLLARAITSFGQG